MTQTKDVGKSKHIFRSIIFENHAGCEKKLKIIVEPGRP